jgi:hypothetical protein
MKILVTLIFGVVCAYAGYQIGQQHRGLIECRDDRSIHMKDIEIQINGKLTKDEFWDRVESFCQNPMRRAI